MVDPIDPINIDFQKLEQSSAAIKAVNASLVNTKAKILDVNKEVETFNSLTSQLNEALKQQVSEIKEVNLNYIKYYELKIYHA